MCANDRLMVAASVVPIPKTPERENRKSKGKLVELRWIGKDTTENQARYKRTKSIKEKSQRPN